MKKKTAATKSPSSPVEPLANPPVASLGALAEYQDWLKAIKQRVASSRLRLALAANSELIQLYYELGAQIVDREALAQWGSGFIDAFSKDLRQAFPDLGGFSAKNLRYCRAFYRFYCQPSIWQQAVAELPATGLAGILPACSAAPWDRRTPCGAASLLRDERKTPSG